MKTERNSNLEILRILAMIMIISHHIAMYSSFSFNNELLNINQYYILFLEMGGKIGSNIFFLITGYFMISKKEINTLKLIQFIVQVLFYSISISVLFIGSGCIDYSGKLVLFAFFPFTYSIWWFASVYLILYLLSPLFNILISAITKEQYKKVLILTTILFSLIPTVFNQMNQCNALIWAIYLYFLGGYIRLYYAKKHKNKYMIPALIGMMIFTYLLTIIIMKIPINIEMFGFNRKQLYEMQAAPILIISVLFLFVFSSFNFKNNKFINLLASCTFGVYLIHEHPYVRNCLYTEVFDNLKYVESPKLIIYTMLEILCIFLIGVLIEYIRKKTINPLIQVIYKKISKK